MGYFLRLKKLREFLGYSQAEMGRMLNVSQNTYCNYELGKRGLNAEKLKKLSQFGISQDWILNGITDRNYAHGLQKTMREQGIRPEELSKKLDLPLKFVEGIICGEIGPADDLFVRMIESIGGNEQKYPRKQSTRESKLAGPPPDGYQVAPQSERVEKLRTQLDTCYERYFDLKERFDSLEREYEKLRKAGS